MGKLIMTPKLLLTFFSLTLVIFSCSNSNSTETISSKSWLDTTTYPKTNFYSVELLTIDKSVDTANSIELEAKGIYDQFPEINIGDFFVDKTGKPLHKFYKKYQLDSFQVTRLEKFLVQSPCMDSTFMDKACFPVYRDVFVFYDKDKTPIAATHICFDCEKAGFSPVADYMCNFENTVNFKALKEFTDSIKLQR